MSCWERHGYKSNNCANNIYEGNILISQVKLFWIWLRPFWLQSSQICRAWFYSSSTSFLSISCFFYAFSALELFIIAFCALFLYFHKFLSEREKLCAIAKWFLLLGNDWGILSDEWRAPQFWIYSSFIQWFIKIFRNCILKLIINPLQTNTHKTSIQINTKFRKIHFCSLKIT